MRKITELGELQTMDKKQNAPELYADTREETRQWFRKAKFGMFIHWGLYALLGKGEWIRNVGKIPLEEYAKLKPQFNPQNFDPAAWAEVAKQSGIKYMVITTKHHDGFCLFDAHNTNWQVTNTPYGKDILREMTEAFELKGIPVGYYYSIMDWYHDDYLPRMPWEADSRPAEGHEVMNYIAYMREHLAQLMTEYGSAPFVLWYDGGWINKPEELDAAATNAGVRKLKPAILINDRHFTKEDLITPEQRIPPTGLFDENGEPALWEACITMTSHWWGYDKNETVYKTPEFLIRMLIDIVSKGGNLLLNIGPKPDGTIQQEFLDRLQAIGRWMDSYSEAIYETTASPFNLLPFYGRVTTKGNKLYVHVFEWPKDKTIRLPNLRNKVANVALLTKNAKELDFARDGRDIVISLPEKPIDPIASVLTVELDAPPKVNPMVIRPNQRGNIELPVLYGLLDGPHGMRIRYESADGNIHAGNWINPKDSVEWTFRVPAPGTYQLWLDYSVQAGQGGSEIELIVNGREVPRIYPNGMTSGNGDSETASNAVRQTCKTRSTQGKFCRRKGVVVRLRKGTNTLKIMVPKIRRQCGMKLRSLELKPLRNR